MDGDPGQPVAPVTDPDPGPEPKKDDGKVPSDDRTPEYIEHCCKGHLPYDPRCEVCIMGSMRSKPATRKLTEGELKVKGYHQCLEIQEGITLRQQHQGRFGWLAQTTHPGLAVAHSVMSSMPPIVGVLEVAHCIYQWIQAHKQDEPHEA